MLYSCRNGFKSQGDALQNNSLKDNQNITSCFTYLYLNWLIVSYSDFAVDPPSYDGGAAISSYIMEMETPGTKGKKFSQNVFFNVIICNPLCQLSPSLSLLG